MNFVCWGPVEENLRVAMRCYARVSDRGETRDYPDLALTSCGMNCAVFNSAMLRALVDEARFRRAVTLAGTHFRHRELGWTFWLCNDLLPAPGHAAARQRFRQLGMEQIAQPPGMVAERLAPPRRPLADLEIRRVTDETTRMDFAHLSSVIFTLAADTARAVYGAPGLWQNPMQGWVAYHGQLPVSIVTVVVGGGALGVYSVGTLPEYQCRGYAETLMRHALDCARQSTGIERTVLQSTAQGLNLYTRLGYRTVTRFGVFINEGDG
jgi:ribosomal protein S18 acetylase RimI-like enzyme